MVRVLGPDDLVLCSGTVRRAPFEVMVTVAAAAGFGGISLYYDEYTAARAAGWTDVGLRSYLDEHNIAVGEFDGRMDWLPGDSDGPTIDEFVNAAGAVGARSITVLETKGRRVGEAIPLAIAAAAFSSVCDRAGEHGLLAHIEYFPVSGIPDVRTAYEVTRRAERANGGVLVDTWHHQRGPDAGRWTADVPGSAVLAVQVSDVQPTPMADMRDEMMHHRLLPGAGAAKVTELISTLRVAGCRAPLGVEVYSDVLAQLDPAAAAAQAAEALRKVVASPGPATALVNGSRRPTSSRPGRRGPP